jgi:hypothetical protein
VKIHNVSFGENPTDKFSNVVNGIFNCNWVDTWWQQYSTHLHTNNTQNNRVRQNTQNGTYITIRILKLTKEHIT